MRIRLAVSAALLLCVASSGTARADDAGDTAFGLGQFIGAASFCKIPRDQINAVAAFLLKSADIDASGASPTMDRFKEGVTDGVKAMSAPDAASCDDVKTKFQEAYDKAK